MFVSGTDGSIPKRSAGKKLSEQGRYKDRSHNFFMRKFQIVSILNTDRSGMFALHKFVQRRVFCSTQFKLNRTIFLYYLQGMSWVLCKAFVKLGLLGSPFSTKHIFFYIMPFENKEGFTRLSVYSIYICELLLIINYIYICKPLL